MAVVDVGLAPALTSRRVALQELLGPGYLVGSAAFDPDGVAILDESARGSVREIRTNAPGLGIIVVLEECDDPSPLVVLALIDEGADVCLVAPGTAGLAAHVRALAAHHPRSGPTSTPVTAIRA
jgi:hypothetical protein